VKNDGIWQISVSSNGNHVNVGNFDLDGWNVNNNYDNNYNPNLRVCLALQFFLYESTL